MDSDIAGPSNSRIVTRKFLFDKMEEQKSLTFEKKLEFLENYIVTYDNYSEAQLKEIKQRFSYLKSQFKQRWSKAQRKMDYFLKQNHEWLQGGFEIPITVRRSGRPQKEFTQSSERTKRRKTEEVRRTTEQEILLHAAQISLQTSGKRTASKVFKDIVTCPQRAKTFKKVCVESKESAENVSLTPFAALSMLVDANLSRRQYEIIRNTNKRFYPCYSLLQRAKQDCYPPKDAYRVTDTCAEVSLQSLMDHTVKRLLQSLEEVISTLKSEERNTLEIICKWGCDGSQQAHFKQKMESDSDDSNIFQSSLVPVQLVCRTKKNDRKVVWQNLTPSSPRYCRPIRIRFVKESVDVTNEEIDYISNASSLLQNTAVSMEDKTYTVKHTLLFTMVDTKVCNAATQTTSTMRCYICNLTAKDFNNLEKKGEMRSDNLQFGLSVLHARIRIFENLLHLAYKLPVKTWQVRASDTANKEAVHRRKSEIQARFRKETGLIVDVPKMGFGNTNDGNTSRRFFADPQLASEITGIDFNLIYRLKVILEVISSGHKINVEKFSEYAMETAKLYVELYPWYPMTSTLHKVLIHGATVIQNSLLPIGQLSEEAAEARNKHFRLYRLNYARKFSRQACNSDVLNRLLLSSDPLLTSMRLKPIKKSRPFLKETVELLMPADPNPLNDSSGDEDTGDEADEDETLSDEELFSE